MFFSFDLCVCERQRERKEGPSVCERQRERKEGRLCVCEQICGGVNTAGSEVKRGEGEKRMKISSKAE